MRPSARAVAATVDEDKRPSGRLGELVIPAGYAGQLDMRYKVTASFRVKLSAGSYMSVIRVRGPGQDVRHYTAEYFRQLFEKAK